MKRSKLGISESDGGKYSTMDTLMLEPTEPASEKPNLEFEPGNYTIPEILDSHLLPIVVQYDSGDQPIPLNKRYFDLTQPLLLYKKRNIQKVSATSLQIQEDRYEDLGESLLIPEDYKGWFAVLQRITGCIKADDAVPHFSSVEELANSNTEKFLIGGTKKIAGLQILDRSEGQIKHEQRCFLPGDTLTIEKIEFGEAKKRTRLFRKPKYIRERFLLCLDESDREILLPFEQQGIFYQISHKSGKPVKNVLQMSDIVARKLTPRIIKLVFGRFPVTPCAFTGLMKAESSRIESSVIASTIVNTQNILMEIPVNNHIRFKIAITNDELRQNSCYRNAMHFCAERASTYMRNIKICYNFTVNGEMPADCILNTPPPEQCSDSPFLIGNETDEFKLSDIVKKTEENKQRHSDISDNEEITLRPTRCLSTFEAGRMSFCFGNSYLTVPMIDGNSEKRSSGNNNTISEITSTSKRGSRISFNGRFLEMEGGMLAEEENAPVSGSTQELPPPMPCTSITSYINVVPLPNTPGSSEFPDYIPASLARRPSSQPPESSPPPIPLSSSTSGVSSGSLSSVSDRDSKRASSDSCEYDVPKTDSSSSSSSIASRTTMITPESTANSESSTITRTRRPSTYTFAEGCVPINRGFSAMQGKLVEELEESQVDVDSPIYENIQSLMEVCKRLDTECEHIEQKGSNLTTTYSSSDESLNELHAIQTEQENLHFEKVFDILLKPTFECEYCEPPDIEIDIDKAPKDTGLASGACGEVRDTSPTNSTSTLSASPKYANSNILSKASSNFDVDTELSVSQNVENVSDNVEKTDGGLNDPLSHYEGVLQANLPKVSSDNEINSENSVPDSSVLQRLQINEEASDCFTIDCATRTDKESKQICSANECDKDTIQFDTNLCHATGLIDNVDNEKGITNEQETVNQPCKQRIQKSDYHSYSASNKDFSNDPDSLRLLTSANVREHLQTIGLRDATLIEVERQDVNGHVLCEVLYGEMALREALVGVNLVDQQKISMYIRGWRPQNE